MDARSAVRRHGQLLQLHEPLARLDARDPRARRLAVGGAVHARGNIAAELELEPRRANLLGAFDDAADGPADEADGQDEPADAADGAAA